jgi:predicted NBD/HSP70 family sugar kinase
LTEDCGMDPPVWSAASPAGPRGSVAYVRELNERTLLELLRASGVRSRAQLARDSGLSKPTVSAALASLERSGLVRSVGSEIGRPGPAALLYEANATAGYVMGVDIGRTWLRVAIADLAGTVAARKDSRNRARSADALVRMIGEVAGATAAEIGLGVGDLTLVVVGSPGVFDPKTRVLKFAPNIPGSRRPGLVHGLRSVFGPNLIIENDINLAAVGEHVFGRARGVANFVLLSIGTGIGMGIVIDHELYRGAHGAAGEASYLPFGEQPLDDLAASDPRTRGGLLDDAASAGGVVRHAKSAGLTKVKQAKDVFDLARAGNAKALRVVETEARRIGVTVTVAAALFDPELVVVSGGLGMSLEVMRPAIEATVRRLSPLTPEIAEGELGDAAIVLGAVATALQPARERVFELRLRASS